MLELSNLIVVVLVVCLHARMLLVWLPVVVSESVLELGVSLRRRVVLHVIHGVSRGIHLSIGDSPDALLGADLKEQVPIRSRLEDKRLTIKAYLLALGDGGCRCHKLRPCLELLLVGVLGPVDHSGEAVVHESLHGLGLGEAAGEVNEDPALGLHLSCQLQVCPELLLP